MSSSGSNKILVLNNFVWRLAERVGAKGVEFLVSIALARLLSPDDFGVIALVTVFISILQVFVDSGLGNALIQKKDADDIDFSTVFYFNIVFCILLYVILFVCAPLIAHFYEKEILTPVIRTLGVTILISGVKNVQQAYVSKNMLFKRFFYATLGGTIGAAFIGIALAYKGFGIWALVAQQVFNVTVDTIILWITVKWRPKKLFSAHRLKSLYSFGWKLLASQLIEITYNDLRQLIIGKMYSASDLAFYNRAKQFPQFITANINTSINSVLFPAMSSVQDEKERVKAMTRRAITISTYIMAPFLMGLVACAEPIVRIILTEKWMPIVPFMRIFCITHMFLPIHTANLNAVKAMGRSDLFLKLEIYKKVVGMVLLLSSMWFGVMAMAYSLLIGSVISQLINTRPNKYLLDYSYREQLRDILPGILLAVAMGLLVHCVETFISNDYLCLAVQIVLGAGFYIVGSKLLKLESYDYVLKIIKSSRLHRKGEL